MRNNGKIFPCWALYSFESVFCFIFLLGPVRLLASCSVQCLDLKEVLRVRQQGELELYICICIYTKAKYITERLVIFNAE